MGEQNGDSVVATESGRVRGGGDDRVRHFRGIPYAAAPINEKRWAAPQPVQSWTGVREATNPGPVCVQPEASDMPSGVPQSEDCLTLDVTVPTGPGENRPVMVWLPGGGFITGAGSIYDPTRLARTGDIVVVTVNYRLGVYGFFAHPELGDSNFGLQDQMAALRWVRANIAHFGGDPAQVTLAGASAGAMSACTLMTAPEARNLFQRAIVQSGSCRTSHPAGALGEGVGAISTWQPLATIQGAAQALAGHLSCADLACLRALPAETLLPYTAMFPLVAYETPLVPREPSNAFAAGQASNIALLRGNTFDEHAEFTVSAYPEPITADRYSAILKTAFGNAADHVESSYPVDEFSSPTAAASRVFSDRDWICGSWRSGRDHAERAPTYVYTFTDSTAPTPGGNPVPALVQPATVHGSEVYFLFDFHDGPQLTSAQRSLAEQLAGYWSRFIRTGDPNGDSAPTWPRLDASDLALSLNPDTIEPVNMRTTHHCDLWDA
ncbi:carboxylesterase/lipase family protein [Nocardia goodfellowii]|uniref:Carboxylic ester hydrolase n=1 Tax=Nocardia goodfellowii TaxID=882446 RepID=A0ABS4QI91_9NOCA|nr:carboxylesterase family protein [Nocardia goodfellowii]MBP2191422.1 para-nitrobenzyl esterase [Nocardia goodfellowii]